MVRQGKGAKDRMVPIRARACAWVDKPPRGAPGAQGRTAPLGELREVSKHGLFGSRAPLDNCTDF
jgi:hypothetical protein